MQCINCGFENVPGLESCARCQSSLSLADADIQPPRRGSGISGLLRSIAWAFRRHRTPVEQRPRYQFMPDLSAWRPVFWSFVPGLGQVKSRQRTLGWVLMGMWGLCLGLAVVLAGGFHGQMAIGGAVAVHCLAISLAMRSILELQSFQFRLLCGLAIFVIILTAYYSMQSLVEEFIRPIELNSVVKNDLLRNNDVVVCLGPLLQRPGTFQRGDLVLYNIPQGVAVDRIVGLPGDRLRIEDGQLLINDVAPQGKNRPIGSITQWRTIREIRAGPGEFLIVPSALTLELHGNNREADARLNELASSVMRVRQGQIVGKVFWRLRPIYRCGRLE